MSKYNWVSDGGSLLSVGIFEDGSLHNPSGYPEEVVRAAVQAADERMRHRRSASAKRTAEPDAIASSFGPSPSLGRSSPVNVLVTGASATSAGAACTTPLQSSAASVRSAGRAFCRQIGEIITASVLQKGDDRCRC